MPMICFQVFHMFYGCMDKISQSETQLVHMGAIHPSHRAPKLRDQIWWDKLQKNHAILRLVYVVIRRKTRHGWAATHSICHVCAWERSLKPGTQLVHWDALHPDHRPITMCAQVWLDLQTTKSSLWKCWLWYKIWGTSSHGWVATLFICLVGTQERCHKPGV